MIELCDIFSLDSPAKQQVLFVKQPFNLSSFRAIFGPAIFYGSRSDSLKFPYHFSREGSQGYFLIASFQIRIVCFERLIGSLDSVFGNAWQNPINWPLRDIWKWSRHRPRYLYFDENRSNAFLFTSKGLMLEGFTTFMDCCLRTRASNVVRNEVDYLGGIDWMAAEEDVLCRTPLIAVVIV